jgi:preprotein translocase subunit SecA
LIEYKIEAYDVFQEMIDTIQQDIAKLMFRVNIVAQQPQPEDHLKNAKESRGEEEPEAETKQKPVVNKEHVGRNDLCPCGSGKKYKNCCGRDK